MENTGQNEDQRRVTRNNGHAENQGALNAFEGFLKALEDVLIALCVLLVATVRQVYLGAHHAVLYVRRYAVTSRVGARSDASKNIFTSNERDTNAGTMDSGTANIPSTSYGTTNASSTARKRTSDLTQFNRTPNIKSTSRRAEDINSSRAEPASPTSVRAKSAAAVKKERIQINFLLMGRTGCGKSSVGNSMINWKFFKTSSDAISETKEIDTCFAEFGEDHLLLLVDSPGLIDTALNAGEDTKTAAKNMDVALALCNGGVDAFLLVLRFGHRFTKEEQDVLETLKRIFGDSYMSHLIVVVTCGDQFKQEMEHEGQDISFQDWCSKQEGELKKLYEDCNGRFVLFNNREKNEEMKQVQIQNVVDIAEELIKNHGRYNDECFEKARQEREKLIVEKNAPILEVEIQQKISLLTGEINRFQTHSVNHKLKLGKRVQCLQENINKIDEGIVRSDDLCDLLEKVQANLSNITELQHLTSNLEEIMKVERKIEAKMLMAAVLNSFTWVGALGTYASDHKETLVEKNKFNLLLLKHTSKESSGSSMLNVSTFQMYSANLTDKGTIVAYREFEDYILKIVDLPINIKNFSERETKTALFSAQLTCSLSDEIYHAVFPALVRCSEGADVFLFNIEFGIKFTSKDRSRLDCYKEIFGESFFNYVVVVVTGDALFWKTMEDDEQSSTFQSWCEELTGELKKLYEDCHGRFVLFYSSDDDANKKRAQIQQIIQFAEDIRLQNGRCNCKNFQNAEYARQELIVAQNKPQLIEGIQEIICLLISNIEEYSDLYYSFRKKMKSRIMDLRLEIKVKDKGFGFLDKLKKDVNDVERNIDEIDQLLSLVKKLEETRKATKLWSLMNSVSHFAKGTWSLAKIQAAKVFNRSVKINDEILKK